MEIRGKVFKCFSDNEDCRESRPSRTFSWNLEKDYIHCAIVCQNRHVCVASWFRLLGYFSNQTLVAPYLLFLWSKAAITCKCGFITEMGGDSFGSLSHQFGQYVPLYYIKQLWPHSYAASPFRSEAQLPLSEKHFPSRTLTLADSAGKTWTIKWRHIHVPPCRRDLVNLKSVI